MLKNSFRATKKTLSVWLRQNKKEFLILTVILLAASFLRLYRIADYLTFLGDEGRDVMVVKRMIVDHKLTLLGPTASVGGFFLGPAYYYFMVPFLWLFGLDPVGPAVMVALFGVATVFLIYKTGRDFFDEKTALLAAGLYSLSPLVIAYSRSSWNPNLMPFFSLLIIWLTRKFALSKRIELLGLIGFLFGILIQLHYLAVFLMVAAGVYLFLFSPLRKKFKFYLWPLAGFLLGWSPFILFELRHRFPNFKTLYQFIFFGEETGFAAKGFLLTLYDVVYRLFYRLVANNNQFLALTLLFGSLGALVFFWQKQKRKKTEFLTLSLLGLWFLLGTTLFVFYQDDVYDYYFGFMFPLPFLLTSFALVKLSAKNRLAKFLSGLIILWLLLVNLKGVPFRSVPNRQLDQTRQIARIILDQAGSEPFNFALITGSNSDHAYRYFLEIWGRPPVTIQNLQTDPERKTVTDQLLVVCEMAECKPLGHSLWEIAGFGRAEIAGTWPAPGGIKVIKLVHYQEE